jgi:HEAT repeat protein
MDTTVGRIVAFLDSDAVELQRAAARVLTELRPGGAKVYEAVDSALQKTADPKLRLILIEAVQVIGGIDAYDRLLSYLDAPGEAGHRAMEMLGALGAPALGRLKRRFAQLGELARRRVLTLAAQLRGTEGMDVIVQALENGHAEEVAEATGRVADQMAAATQRERTTLLKRLEKFLDSVDSKSNPGSVAAGIDLLTHIVGGKAQQRLLAYSEAGHQPRVRRRALEALAEIAAREKLDTALLTKLLAYLKESDFTHVVAPAMRVLERAKLDAVHAAPLLALVGSPDPALRRFAVTALGQVDSPQSAEALLGILRGDNPDLQRRAAESLARQARAVPAVAAALAAAPDPGTAWILARILQPHRLTADQVTALARATVRWLEPGDPRAEPALTILRERNFDILERVVLARVKRIRKVRRAGDVVNLLRPFADEESPEVAYELAIAEVIRGRKDVLREVRLANPGLQGLVDLHAAPDSDLAARLRREKDLLTPEEFYLIGCHFAERAHGDRVFGGDLLQWLVRTFPEDAAARAAEHKLLMEGFPPPPRPAPAPRRRERVAKQAAPKSPAATRTAKKPAAAKKTTKKKTAPKKATAKKAPAKKTTAKKTTAKKAAPKKTGASKRAAARKTSSKKAGVRGTKAATKKPPRRRHR